MPSLLFVSLQMKTWTSTRPSTAAAVSTWSGCPAQKECWTTWAWRAATRTPSPNPATTWQPNWRSACGSSGRWGGRWAGSWTRSSRRKETSGTWRSGSVGGIQPLSKVQTFSGLFSYLHRCGLVPAHQRPSPEWCPASRCRNRTLMPPPLSEVLKLWTVINKLQEFHIFNLHLHATQIAVRNTIVSLKSLLTSHLWYWICHSILITRSVI